MPLRVPRACPSSVPGHGAPSPSGACTGCLHAQRRGRAGVVWLVAVVLVGLLAWFVHRTADEQARPPRLSGALWRAAIGDRRFLAYVTAEERRRTQRRVGRPSTFVSRPYTRYALQLRPLPDGEPVRTLLLADRDGAADGEAPQVLGIVDDVLWLWRDSLEGVRLPDLTLQLTPATLTASLPALRELLPSEPRGYAVAGGLRTLVARGRDARLYRIDATPAGLAPLDPAELPPTNNSTRVEDRFDYLVPPGRSRVMTDPQSALQRHFLTNSGFWYALLSEDERRQQQPFPSEEDRPFGQVARLLHRTTYRLDGRGRPEIDVRGIESLGSDRLLQAGFLVRAPRRVWDVPDPSSSLVLARPRLGEREPWEVVRLTREGRIRWRTSTGLPQPTLLIDLGAHIGFFGEVPGARRGEGEAIVWIDERSGERRVLSLATGVVRAGPDGGAPARR